MISEYTIICSSAQRSFLKPAAVKSSRRDRITRKNDYLLLFLYLLPSKLVCIHTCGSVSVWE